MSIRFRFPAHIRLIDGGGDEGGSNDGGDGGEPRSFTQEQVDQIVEKRLAKERGKYKDYDELKSKAMKLDEMENAGKSEIDKLKESNAALRKRIDDAAAEKQHAEWVSKSPKTRTFRPNCCAAEQGGTRGACGPPARVAASGIKPPQVRNQTGSPSHQNNNKGRRRALVHPPAPRRITQPSERTSHHGDENRPDQAPRERGHRKS